MRKKKDISRHELVELLDKLLKQSYTKPTSEKNIRLAFKEFVEEYPSIIYFDTWKLIYTEGKTSLALAEEIISASKACKPQKSFKYGQGKGGKRGVGKEMQMALEVEKILFNPQEILQKHQIKLSDFKFRRKIRDRSNKYLRCTNYELSAKEPIDLVVDDSFKKLIAFYDLYAKSFKPDKPKYRQVLDLLFMRKNKYPDLSCIDIPSSKGKGKRVTAKGIFKGIYAVKKYVFHKRDPFPHLKVKAIKKGKLYKDNKFYYFSFLMCSSVDLLGDRFDPTIRLIKEGIIKKIKPIMEKLPYESQLEIVKTLSPPPPAYDESIVE